jgi:hypothetical protein
MSTKKYYTTEKRLGFNTMIIMLPMCLYSYIVYNTTSRSFGPSLYHLE